MRSIFASLAVVVLVASCGGDDEDATPPDLAAAGTEGGAGIDGSSGGNGGNGDGAASDGSAIATKIALSFFQTLPYRPSDSTAEMPIVAVPGGGYVIALRFSGPYAMAGQGHMSSGNAVALIKVDAKGNPLWTKIVLPNHESHTLDLAVDGAGAIYLAGGTLSTSVDFGNGKTLTFGDGTKAWGFVAKLDAAGDAQWARRFNSQGGFLTMRLAARNDAVILAGVSALGMVSYETAQGLVVSPAFKAYEAKAFVLALAPSDGLGLWFEQMAGASGGHALDVAITKTNDVVIAGQFKGGPLETDDPLKLVDLTGTFANAFVSRFTSTGTHAWTRAFAGKSAGHELQADVLALDDKGQVVAAGTDFDTGAKSGSPWVVSLDLASGTTTWEKTLPTGYPAGVALDAKGRAALSLRVDKAAASATVDGIALPTASAFIAGLDVAGNVSWVHAATAAAQSVAAGRMASGGNDLVELGWFTGTADFGGGPITSHDGGIEATPFLLGLTP